jgi:hypothetical protein
VSRKWTGPKQDPCPYCGRSGADRCVTLRGRHAGDPAQEPHICRLVSADVLTQWGIEDAQARRVRIVEESYTDDVDSGPTDPAWMSKDPDRWEPL